MFNRFKSASIRDYQSEELIQHIVQRTQESRQLLERESKIDRGLVNALLAISFSLNSSGASLFRIIDLGGATALLFETIKFLYPEVDFYCTVIETPKMVEANKARVTENLSFLTLSDFGLVTEQDCDILIANSSLQYLDNPLQDLQYVMDKADVKFLFVGKTPFSNDFSTIQGTQRSLLGSNGPAGLQGFTKKEVELDVKIVSFLNFFHSIGDKWNKIYEIEDGVFQLKCSDKGFFVTNFPTRTIFLKSTKEQY